MKYSKTSGPQDILHAAALIVAVPLLFWGAYVFLKETHKPIVENVEPYDPKKLLFDTKDTVQTLIGRGTPPPGDAWIQEIESLQHKLIDLNLSAPTDLLKKEQVGQQLTRFKAFVEQNKNDVPATVGRDSNFGKSLFRVAVDLDQLAHIEDQSKSRPNIETEFKTNENRRVERIEDEIRLTFEIQLQPFLVKHESRLREIQRETIELEETVAAHLQEISTVQRDSERKLLRQKMAQDYERDRAEIQRLLSPFISRAYTQLGENRNHWLTTPEFNPVSYSDLERLSALQPTSYGLNALLDIGGSPIHHTPNTCRPIGAFPENTGISLTNPSTLQSVKRAQELLRKHGPYLIEIGLLLP